MPAYDRTALEARYAEERAKRERDDGPAQFRLLAGPPAADLLADPFVPIAERAPVADHVTYTHVGGGFGGLTAGARLAERGIKDVRIVETGGDFGGTWYWSRYPGAMCDTASLVYMPLLEETNYMPTRKYASGHEIFEHCQRIGRKYGLYDEALFHTSVVGLTWDDATSVWTVETDRGDRFTSQFVCISLSPFPIPKLPEIPGLGTFKGVSFHTSRWRYDLTGGSDCGDPMDKLKDKKVGIVGTGATAIQAVPELAKAAKELFVFQRTPTSVDYRNNGPIDPDWFAGIAKPGWQKRWIENFTANESRFYEDRDLVMDGWTDIGRRILDKVKDLPPAERTPEAMDAAYDDADFERMESIRARVDEVVKDKATAAKLKAYYRQFCKRPGFHDEYLQSFNLPNVHLVDTDGKGIDAVTENGLVANGTEYGLDMIIWASGFAVGTPPMYPISGRAGITLPEAWPEWRMRSLHGMHTRGLPNLFWSGMMQGAALGSNIPHNINECAHTIAAVVAHAVAEGYREVEVSQEAQDAWVRGIAERGWKAHKTMGDNDCLAGYYNNYGKQDDATARYYRGYEKGPVAFFKHIEGWRTSGKFEGLEFK
ncbi:cyclohexanone monooxygenase [Hyaloraphidium curvatum]|nr:cyclohexanone monooxygenase [Hyaloraphidium curvatum]